MINRVFLVLCLLFIGCGDGGIQIVEKDVELDTSLEEVLTEILEERSLELVVDGEKYAYFGGRFDASYDAKCIVNFITDIDGNVIINNDQYIQYRSTQERVDLAKYISSQPDTSQRTTELERKNDR